jgi:hypothetical protein
LTLISLLMNNSNASWKIIFYEPTFSLSLSFTQNSSLFSNTAFVNLPVSLCLPRTLPPIAILHHTRLLNYLISFKNLAMSNTLFGSFMKISKYKMGECGVYGKKMWDRMYTILAFLLFTQNCFWLSAYMKTQQLWALLPPSPPPITFK